MKLKKLRKKIAAEFGYTFVGGSGCDANNRVYGTTNDNLIKTVYKYMKQSNKTVKAR